MMLAISAESRRTPRISEGSRLAGSTPSQVLYQEAKEIVISLAFKVGGLVLQKYFVGAAAQFIGCFLDGLGSVLIAASLGATASYFLEKKIPDQILGEWLSPLVEVSKYSLPIFAALGVCHLLYGSTLVTTVLIELYQFRTFDDLRFGLYQAPPLFSELGFIDGGDRGGAASGF